MELAKLKETFAGESALALARAVFGLFKGLNQNIKSLVVYERNFCYAFECSSLDSCPLPTVLQVMCQVRGLNLKYSKTKESLRDM